MTKRYSRLPVASVAIALGLVLFVVSPARAQKSSAQSGESDPAAALTDALVAACRANETQFSGFLAGDNGAAFLALPEPQRVALMKRLSLSDSAGKPLISNDNQNRTVLRCRAAETTVEFRFGTPRTHENL